MSAYAGSQQDHDDQGESVGVDPETDAVLDSQESGRPNASAKHGVSQAAPTDAHFVCMDFGQFIHCSCGEVFRADDLVDPTHQWVPWQAHRWRKIADELYVVGMVLAPDPEREYSDAEQKWLDRRVAALRAYQDAEADSE